VQPSLASIRVQCALMDELPNERAGHSKSAKPFRRAEGDSLKCLRVFLEIINVEPRRS
jgi:hypothetical protein